MLVLTACEVNGVPSWNLTPGRSLNVQVLPSGVTSQAVARAGWSSIFSFQAVKPSYRLASGCWNGPVPGAGSRLAGSVPSATMKSTSFTSAGLAGGGGGGGGWGAGGARG